MKLARTKAKTALSLGLSNLFRVLAYRLGVRTGFNPVRRLQANAPQPPFFKISERVGDTRSPSHQWLNEANLFGWLSFPVSEPAPDWHLSPFTGCRVQLAEAPWWKIPDFDPNVGDIKAVWDASRFDWVLNFAQRVAAGQDVELNRLNAWLGDWVVKNPPYRGPNWKCGQEASIRVMHLAFAAMILDQTGAPRKGLIDLVRLHLQRIEPTISYAVAQDNNHGTSEAAALYIGGSWLARLDVDDGERWHRLGCKWLENRISRLVALDGSFSQYSLNYHRIMLDTLNLVEAWRRHLDLPAFSSLLRMRMAAASRWLMAMVDPTSGDAPNLGANDGARLLPLTDTDYRDFRPSVQLAMALFTGTRAYAEDGPWNEQLAWLGVELPEHVSALPGSQLFDDGGYAVLRREKAMVLFRYPRFKFRPGQADALHLDLWWDGENLLRDAGTYSYNTDPEWLAYFPGTVSHNTVQFDDRDQMPRLSRFLFGDWLKTESLQPLIESSEETTFGAAYRDKHGARHQRFVRLMNDRVIVRDEVTGFVEKAVLRWRVRPGDWYLEGQRFSDGNHELTISSSVLPTRIELVNGWESRYYMQKNPVPVLEIEVHEPAVLTTEYRWTL